MGNNSKTKHKSPETKNKRAITRAIQNLVLWIIISAIILFFAFSIEKTYSSMWTSYDWLPKVAIAVTVLLFNLGSADILRYYIKQHGRNVISWTTAIIVFTPIITGIAYLITWPKNQKFTGLD